MDFYLGQVILFAGSYVPQNWALCNGQLLSISENEPLFQLIGTQFGGDGIRTFGVPDLRGRAAIGTGQGSGLSSYALGNTAGVESVTLALNQIPAHNHIPAAAPTGNTSSPSDAIWAADPTGQLQQYCDQDTLQPDSIASNAIGSVGGGQKHDNIPPYLALNYIICLLGIYPTSPAQTGPRGPVTAQPAIDAYLGSIELFAFNAQPSGWLPCWGQTVQISDYQALFNVIGTTYGGDGKTTFQLPDLQGRAAINQGQGSGLSNYKLGDKGGAETEQLTIAEMPTHTHAVTCTTATGTTDEPDGNLWATEANGVQIYSNAPSTVQMNAEATSEAGGTMPDYTAKPHENRSPVYALNYYICVNGIPPSQNDATAIISPWVGQVSLFAFEMIPDGWKNCNGATLGINSYQALNAVLSTNFNGQKQPPQTFNIPDLRGRRAIGSGQGATLSNYSFAQSGGVETVTLSLAQIPSHNHLAISSDDDGNTSNPTGAFWAVDSSGAALNYAPSNGTLTSMNKLALASTGNSNAHNNLPPYLTANYCICASGFLPPGS